MAVGNTASGQTSSSSEKHFPSRPLAVLPAAALLQHNDFSLWRIQNAIMAFEMLPSSHTFLSFTDRRCGGPRGGPSEMSCNKTFSFPLLWDENNPSTRMYLRDKTYCFLTTGDEERRLPWPPASVGGRGSLGQQILSRRGVKPENMQTVKTPSSMNNNDGRALQGIPEEEPELHPWY